MLKTSILFISISWLGLGHLQAADSKPLKFAPDQLIRVLELCTQDADPEIVTEAMLRLTGKPTEIYARETYKNPDLNYLNVEIAKRHGELNMQELGRLMLDDPSSLPDGLPSLVSFPHPERLGPLFSGMIPYTGDPTDLKITFGPLEQRMTDDWLNAANRCSAHDFIHRIQACRGKTGELLLIYQKANNESGILRLGEMLGLYPSFASSIRAEEFTSHTLSILLAGALGVHRRSPDEQYQLFDAAASWRNTHPSLFKESAAMISKAAVLPWLDAVVQFHRGERIAGLNAITKLRMAPKILSTLKPADAIKSKDSLNFSDCYKLGGFISSMLTSPACPLEEIPELASSLPSDLLTATINKMLTYAGTDDETEWRGTLLLLELNYRKDLPKKSPIFISRRDASKIAERWSQSGNLERSQRLIEASKILKP